MSRPAVDIHAGASAAEIAELAAHLRPQDRAECIAGGCSDVHAAISEGVAHSLLSWTARVDGRVACIFGVRPVTFLGREGVPWMLGTPLVAQHARAFIKNSRPYIAQMLRAYPHLMNYVHAPNHQAIGWLKRMGFVLGPAVMAPTGELFHPFEMRAPHV